MKIKIMVALSDGRDAACSVSINYLCAFSREEIEKLILEKAKADEDLKTIISLDDAKMELLYATVSLIPEKGKT